MQFATESYFANHARYAGKKNPTLTTMITSCRLTCVGFARPIIDSGMLSMVKGKTADKQPPPASRAVSREKSDDEHVILPAREHAGCAQGVRGLYDGQLRPDQRIERQREGSRAEVDRTVRFACR